VKCSIRCMEAIVPCGCEELNDLNAYLKPEFGPLILQNMIICGWRCKAVVEYIGREPGSGTDPESGPRFSAPYYSADI
jgi:hypothetical protein